MSKALPYAFNLLTLSAMQSLELRPGWQLKILWCRAYLMFVSRWCI